MVELSKTGLPISVSALESLLMARLILMRLERRADTQAVAVVSDQMIPPLRVVITNPLVRIINCYNYTPASVSFSNYRGYPSILQHNTAVLHVGTIITTVLLTKFGQLEHGGLKKDGSKDHRVKGN